MSFCPNCGSQVPSDNKFCSVCGSPVDTEKKIETPINYTVAEPTYTAYSQPAYPTYTEPVVAAPAPVSAKSKVKGFIGMGVSIEGFIVAILGVIYTLISIAFVAEPYMYEAFIGMFVMAAIFNIIGLVSCIIGRVLCRKSEQEGFTSKACSVGSKLGLVGIILSAVALGVGIICLIGA